MSKTPSLLYWWSDTRTLLTPKERASLYGLLIGHATPEQILIHLRGRHVLISATGTPGVPEVPDWEAETVVKDRTPRARRRK